MKKIILFCGSLFIGLGISVVNAREQPICRAREIGGIEFRFCLNKEILKKDDKCRIQFFAKIPNEKDIYVTFGDIESQFVRERNEMIYYLGGANILGDYIPQFLDLKRYHKTKNNLYRDKKTIKIAELEKQYKKKISGTLTLSFVVAFSKQIMEPLKTILLTETWYPYRDIKEKWYPECYASFYENYVSDEEVGSIKIEIKE